MKIFYLSIFIFLTTFNFALSQVEEKGTIDTYLSIDRTAITPTRYLEEIKKLPVSASVITKEDIKISNPNQTTDILEYLPGLFIRKTGAFGRADVVIRGIGDNGRQIGVFIDGRPDKMGIFGCSVTHTLPLNNVERIEVIRGPESVLYGSEAFGGIINIITHRAKKNIEGSLIFSAGSFNTLNTRLQFGTKQNKFDTFISYDKRSTDGHIVNSSYTAQDFTGQFGYKFTDSSDLSFSIKTFSGIKNEPSPSPAGTWNDYNRGSYDLTFKNTINLTNISAKIYRSYGEHKFSDGFHSTDYTNGLMLHGNSLLGTRNELGYGFDYRYQAGTILNITPAIFKGDYHKYEYGIYLNDKHNFTDKLSVEAGARYNFDEFAKNSITPKFGMIYIIGEKTTLRGIQSYGFRAPQLNDLYLFMSANKELKPEKIVNKEAGFRHQIGEGVFIDAGVFVMNGSDLIRVVSGKKQNTGTFEYKGLETIINIKLSNSLNAQANWTYTDFGIYTMGKPMDKIVASINYNTRKIKALLTGEHIGRYYANDNSTDRINDYTVFNTKVIYKLVENFECFISIDNLTDTEYQIFNDFSGKGLYTMPKRSINFGMNYNF